MLFADIAFLHYLFFQSSRFSFAVVSAARFMPATEKQMQFNLLIQEYGEEAAQGFYVV